MTAIKVENLGKRYVIDHQKQQGHYRYDTLGGALANCGKQAYKFLRHPFSNLNNTLEHEEFWALKDINFEINQGDRVGIIGRNGAGKSTLLKVLSRITAPTKGKITINGRVSSLLEVGTGFHPELTGRENIFLNGAILGMKRQEIKNKFDEIVAFAEVEKFLDTPVKHYSSGMYVRLAFAVAAHLEPEILIVDEVLAVGDIQFQKKCLGKMEEVGKNGRTILFVSHNMSAIRNLCNKGLLINNKITYDGIINKAIDRYLESGLLNDNSIIVWNKENAPKTEELIFKRAFILNDAGEYASIIDSRKKFTICLEYQIIKPLTNLRIGFFMQSIEGTSICGSNDPGAWHKETREPACYLSKCTFPGYVLNQGRYSINFGADIPPYLSPLISTPYCLNIIIEDILGHWPTNEKLPGIVRPNLEWDIIPF